ncbi:hypothetical protein DPMN_040112 [Dreissena polymorpha]|uniref:Uncharacterized protein n=1 Tax=Dreissena polymorpha TaxID=45954 RepID=A0A9D4CW26_DREPO|nr:hypothetical protein DPMN_040112 [Dreissena polymorpha]
MAEGGIGCTESETGCSNLYSRHSKNYVESVSVEICSIIPGWDTARRSDGGGLRNIRKMIGYSMHDMLKPVNPLESQLAARQRG